MALKYIYSFLTHAGKGEDTQPTIGGTRVTQKTKKLYRMLESLYKQSEIECGIEICFKPNAKGAQQNECRDLIVKHVKKPTIRSARALALRLQGVTTNRSKLGLLFLMVGDEPKGRKKVVLSRFPADSGFTAEQSKDELTVQFIEQVFMKSATSYKAACYLGRPIKGDFWLGAAVDKQLGNSLTDVSEYWIHDFLLSDFRTTSATGTRRLAIALRKATRSAINLRDKQQIVAAAALAPNLAGSPISIAKFAKKYGLSNDAISQIKHHLPNDSVYTENFVFDGDEYAVHAPHRTIEMDTGAILSAPADSFDDVFSHEDTDDNTKRVRYIAEGRIVDEKLRKH